MASKTGTAQAVAFRCPQPNGPRPAAERLEERYGRIGIAAVAAAIAAGRSSATPTAFAPAPLWLEEGAVEPKRW